MKIDLSQYINLQNKNLVCEGIIYAVDIHRKAMKLVSIINYINSNIKYKLY